MQGNKATFMITGIKYITHFKISTTFGMYQTEKLENYMIAEDTITFCFFLSLLSTKQSVFYL